MNAALATDDTRAFLPVRMWRSWCRFWFNPADPTLLGLVRICAGLMVLYVHLAYTFDLDVLIGRHAWLDLETITDFRQNIPILPPTTGWEPPPLEEPPLDPEARQRWQEDMQRWGIDTRGACARGRWITSIWFHITDPGWIRVLHGCFLLAMVLFTLGVATRVTSVLTWLIALSYIQRAHTSLFGMDTIMIIVLLYLMMGPSGAALSVDRLVARYRATRRALATGQPVPVRFRPEPSVSANLALRLLQVHLCIIYMASGLSKLQGQTWWSGTAVWGTMANYEFSPLHLPFYQWALQMISQHRWLWEVMTTSLTLFTLVFEISFAYLVWLPRWRWLMILAAVGLHLGIAIFMGLVTFSLMMMTLLLAFVPPEAVYRMLRWLGRGAEDLWLAFRPADPRQARAASLVHALDVWGQVELEAAGTSPHLQLRTEKGELLTGYPLFERLARGLRLTRPVAWLTWVPGVGALGRAWYPPAPSASGPGLKNGRAARPASEVSEPTEV